MVYKHLNAETNAIMGKSYEVKLDWINRDHFVYYDKAYKVLDELERVYHQALPYYTDIPTDQNSVGIAGHSGTGKTMILREFQRRHSNRPDPPPNQLNNHNGSFRWLVAYSLMRDAITGMRGLYSSILGGIGHPYGDFDIVTQKKIQIAALEDTLIYLLKQGQIRVFILDEFQHARSKDYAMQISFLNQLKRTMLECKVPFIPVGTLNVITVLSVDDQLPNRCKITENTLIDYWDNDDQFKEFLGGYENFLPFPEPSNLSSEDIANKIFGKVKFPHPDAVRPELKPLHSIEKANKISLRDLVKYLKKIASMALYNELDCITEETIDATPA